MCSETKKKKVAFWKRPIAFETAITRTAQTLVYQISQQL